MISRMKISKPYGQNYSGTKIITPYILLVPTGFVNTCGCHPAGSLMKTCNSYQCAGQKMTDK